MLKFTEIGQLRNVIREVRTNHDYQGSDAEDNPIYEHSSPYPKLTFRGTVKMHGTNSGIKKEYVGEYEVKYTFQSRERELELNFDNAGFMNAMLNKDFEKLFDDIKFNNTCVIYGEWCGGTIQKTVALNQLEKMFVIFAIRIDGEYKNLEDYKHIKNEAQRIYNILDFPTVYVDIDFNVPELAQNKIIELTLAVEDECPVAKQLGATGIGEGIVFESHYNGHRYIFKSKGVKHQNSKVKTLKPVDDEKVGKCMEVAEQITPTWRLEQMLEAACDTMNGGVIDRKHMGNYMKLVIADIQKEDSDVIAEAGLELKDVAKYVSEIAKAYFFEQEKLSL